MSNRDRMEYTGVVTDINKDKFTIQIDTEQTALCTLSGKIRQNSVKILVGDTVKIEVSPYDPGKGRITYRIK